MLEGAPWGEILEKDAISKIQLHQLFLNEQFKKSCGANYSYTIDSS